jgi:type IV pilus assembly protein PilW
VKTTATHQRLPGKPRLLPHGSNRGFSLLELMVAMAVVSILLAGIYAAYITQLRSYMTQQMTLEMQQNLRVAMQIMARDIRMAGFDPTRSANAGVITMLANTFRFSADKDQSGVATDSDEDITYAINNNGSLGRQTIVYDPVTNTTTSSGLQPVAENIDALNFVYLDANGVITSNPTAVASVQVTIVGRSSKTLPVMLNRQTDRQVYFNQQGQIILPAPNDMFRRMILTSEIKCRNL